MKPKSKRPAEKLVSLRLTIEQATLLCREIAYALDDERGTTEHDEVYRILATAKARAVQRQCSRI